MKKCLATLLYVIICILAFLLVFILTGDMWPIIEGIPYDPTGGQVDIFSCMYWMWMLVPMFVGIGYCLDSAIRNQKIVLGRYGTYKRYWYRLFCRELAVYGIYAIILLAAVAIAYETDCRTWQAASIFLTYVLLILCIYTVFCWLAKRPAEIFVIIFVFHLLFMLADSQTKCRYSEIFAPCYGMINRSELMTAEGMRIWWIFGVETIVIAVCILVMPVIIKKRMR